MNDKEMRELDAWIAEHVIGWKRVYDLADWDDKTFITNKDGEILVAVGHQSDTNNWKPTVKSQNAMDVLRKCVEKLNGFELQIDGPIPWVVRSGNPKIKTQFSETLELAICLFAKQLFSKK